MSYVYFCARSPGKRTELIPADERANRWTHVNDLCGVLETEQKIPHSEHEVPSSRINEISNKYSGRYIALDRSQ